MRKNSGAFSWPILALALFCLSALTLAQTAPPVSADQSQVRNLVVYPAPPAGFNPLVASPAALATYGFPPAPDPVAAPKTYARWQRLASAPQTRLANPLVQQMEIHHGPPLNLSLSPAGGGSYYSSNWSGIAEVLPSGTFKANLTYAVEEFVVPVVQQAVGTCNSSWWYSSQWVGFDGVTSNDVLQAGANEAAVCSHYSGQVHPYATYWAWLEWYPNAELRIANFQISPGDVVGVEVWYTTTSPHGNVYLVNLTTESSVAFGINPPPGTSFAGDSVEWIVERPSVNGALANLANYTAVPLIGVAAIEGVGELLSAEGSPYTYYLTMVCPPWSPASGCSPAAAISVAEPFPPATLWFYNEGPSRGSAPNATIF